MGKQIYKKLHRNRGIARLVVILSVLALVLVAAALYPVIQHYRFDPALPLSRGCAGLPGRA